MTANDTQIGGTHYKRFTIQPWDYILANKLGFLEGNVIKYVTRWEEKNGIKDLQKAVHCLQKLIETEEQKEPIQRKWRPELPESYQEMRE